MLIESICLSNEPLDVISVHCLFEPPFGDGYQNLMHRRIGFFLGKKF